MFIGANLTLSSDVVQDKYGKLTKIHEHTRISRLAVDYLESKMEIHVSKEFA